MTLLLGVWSIAFGALVAPANRIRQALIARSLAMNVQNAIGPNLPW
jgi:hypothetical protein